MCTNFPFHDFLRAVHRQGSALSTGMLPHRLTRRPGQGINATLRTAAIATRADPRRYTPKGMPELPSSAASFRACSARAHGGSSSSSSASFCAAAAAGPLRSAHTPPLRLLLGCPCSSDQSDDLSFDPGSHHLQASLNGQRWGVSRLCRGWWKVSESLLLIALGWGRGGGKGRASGAKWQRACSVDGLGSGDAKTSQDCLPVIGLSLRVHRCGADSPLQNSCVVCPDRLMEQASRTAGLAEHLHSIVFEAVFILSSTLAAETGRFSWKAKGR
jgi:hypothetical protein